MREVHDVDVKLIEQHINTTIKQQRYLDFNNLQKINK